MAQFSINVDGKVNAPPSQLGVRSITLLNRTNGTITQSDFTATTPPYIDPDGDLPQTVKILTIPSTGSLRLNGVAVVVNQDISYTDIGSNLLIYIPASQDAAYSESFTFDIADEGSSTFAGLIGTVNISVQEYVNQPPSAVGNNTLSNIAFDSTYVFTAADFTTGTTPAYADPEGDAASQLRILNVPTNGTLLLNGSQVVTNQIINFSDISAGNFSFLANGNTAGYTASFDFEIADAGSGQFSA